MNNWRSVKYDKPPCDQEVLVRWNKSRRIHAVATRLKDNTWTTEDYCDDVGDEDPDEWMEIPE